MQISYRQTLMISKQTFVQNVRIPLFFLVIVLTDQITKTIAINNLSYGEEFFIIPHVNLYLIFNTGAAFSLMSDGFVWQRVILISLPIIAITFFSYIIFFSREKSLIFKLAISLIAAGAFGNLIDRVFYGYVIDFIDIYWGDYHWPTFNVADSSITVGAGFIIYQEIKNIFSRET